MKLLLPTILLLCAWGLAPAASERTMLVIAHPDDEILVAATLLARVQAGHELRVVTATSGEATPDRSGQGRTGADLVRAREAESTAGLASLDLPAPTFLRLPDGRLGEHLDRLVELLHREVADFGPTTVITFGPDGLYGHPDHRAIGLAAGLVVDRAPAVGVLLHIASSRTRFDLARRIDAGLGERLYRCWVADEAIGLRVACPPDLVEARSGLMASYPSLFGEAERAFWMALCAATDGDEFIVARRRLVRAGPVDDHSAPTTVGGPSP